MRMLDRVQESIARALQDVAEHERTLEVSEPATATDLAAAERGCLDQFDERLRNLQSHVEAADDAAAQVDELLTEDEREARTWLGQAAAARSRLATAGAVGLS